MPRSHQHLPRLFVAFDLGEGTAARLESGQAHYLANVLRRQAGDEVVLFNGRDGAWRSRLAEVSRKGVTAEPIGMIAAQTPPSDLWYGFAPLKSARLDYVVEKATEMGAGLIQPVLTRFTQLSRLREDKLRANIIEAAEQCEVLSVPELLAPMELARLIVAWPEQHADRALLFCDEAAPSGSPAETLKPLAGRRIGMLVGPEGGFAPEERELLLAQDFVVPISLGPRILRADTAAVAALAVVQAIIGDWR
jgi:16S rRNA (uracil1498-N3)-methyltransferase